MRSTRVALAVLASTVLVSPARLPAQAMTQPIVIHADRIVDGRGKVIPGGVVVVSGDKITRVDQAPAGAVTYDLKGYPLLRGLIDAHPHLPWYFNRQGRYHSRGTDQDTPVESMLST